MSPLDQLLDPQRAELARQHDEATTSQALARRMPAPVVTPEEKAELLRLWDEYERAHDAWHAQDLADLGIGQPRPIVLNEAGFCVTGSVLGSQPVLGLQSWAHIGDCGSLDAPEYVPTGGHYGVELSHGATINAEQSREAACGGWL